MLFSHPTFRALLGVLLSLLHTGCAPRLSPAVPVGIALQPGRYLTAFYRAPDFTPAAETYTLEPFPVAEAGSVDSQAFQEMLTQELTRAWQANGLALSPRGPAVITGTVQLIQVRGEKVRRFTGKISADFMVSGAITKGGQVLFAFQDRIYLSSPVQPGPPAPKEKELLLRFVAQTFAAHLLNEMLLYWPPAEGK